MRYLLFLMAFVLLDIIAPSRPKQERSGLSCSHQYDDIILDPDPAPIAEDQAPDTLELGKDVLLDEE